MGRREEIMERIRNKSTNDIKGCWVWQGTHSGTGRGGGYPRMSLDGATMAVHRVMWSCVNGPIPHKKQIDHTCENRMCVNPDHLEMVTNLQNQRRKKKR